MINEMEEQPENQEKQSLQARPRPAQPGRVLELQREIGELKRSWPAHSVPAAMLLRLEELEDALELELEKDKASKQ